MRGFNSSFVGAGANPQTWRSSEPFAAAYADYASEAVELPQTSEAAAPPPKPHFDATPFKRLSAEEIATDIDVLASDTPSDLQRKRRSFARLNHPDRTPSEWRDAATTRMKIANQLIDEALRKAVAKQA
ncbi:MAG: hypothetical protein KUA43_19025 [Hoeflea sp.]|uniref:hypothetical protein n=1 Tax=Hoeflea sp. TaxID=1940281 RepID=UPI001D549E67|nr:hypothetical protein [Hoeflea sp.]MBU4527258.1 hypothetical protein [Alphaproteobacteria bacterium]MBU4546959.1 hypothetical protein [Alphaproteobacteria bacterium]MBU4551529.1 hypothetical protein [Alphaproteobacteria bacterium]MBV1725534.1 hypothetical protein [Hoeflea sp.]MBV1759582.1 hypothetical protein [Hoeflea sp.]